MLLAWVFCDMTPWAEAVSLQLISGSPYTTFSRGVGVLVPGIQKERDLPRSVSLSPLPPLPHWSGVQTLGVFFLGMSVENLVVYSRVSVKVSRGE